MYRTRLQYPVSERIYSLTCHKSITNYEIIGPVIDVSNSSTVSCVWKNKQSYMS